MSLPGEHAARHRREREARQAGCRHRANWWGWKPVPAVWVGRCAKCGEIFEAGAGEAARLEGEVAEYVERQRTLSPDL